MTVPNSIPIWKTKPSSEMIRIYTYQTDEAIALAKSRGYFSGDLNHFDNDPTMPDDPFVPAYEWMREQMRDRLENFSGDFPIWCWINRPSARKSVGWEGDTRIIADVPRSRILLSDYHDWHDCLNNSPVTFTEAEWDEYDARFPTNLKSEEHREYVQSTWPRVLEFGQRKPEEYAYTGGNPRRVVVQGCVDRLRIDEIVSWRYFEKKGK